MIDTIINIIFGGMFYDLTTIDLNAINPNNTVHLMIDVQKIFCKQDCRHLKFAQKQQRFQNTMLDYHVKSINVEFYDFHDWEAESKKPTHKWDTNSLLLSPLNEDEIDYNCIEDNYFIPDIVFPSKSPYHLVKSSYSAFDTTWTGPDALVNFLRNNQVKNIIVTGLYDRPCITETKNHATEYGFNAIIPYDQIYRSEGETELGIKEKFVCQQCDMLYGRRSKELLCHSSELFKFLTKPPVFA